jgi:hypothetical protein
METKPHLMFWGDLRQYYLTAEYLFAREYKMHQTEHSYFEIVPHQAKFASAECKFDEAYTMFQYLSERI